jgi:hypothetical protein
MCTFFNQDETYWGKLKRTPIFNISAILILTLHNYISLQAHLSQLSH